MKASCAARRKRAAVALLPLSRSRGRRKDRQPLRAGARVTPEARSSFPREPRAYRWSVASRREGSQAGGGLWRSSGRPRCSRILRATAGSSMKATSTASTAAVGASEDLRAVDATQAGPIEVARGEAPVRKHPLGKQALPRVRCCRLGAFGLYLISSNCSRVANAASSAKNDTSLEAKAAPRPRVQEEPAVLVAAAAHAFQDELQVTRVYPGYLDSLARLTDLAKEDLGFARPASSRPFLSTCRPLRRISAASPTLVRTTRAHASTLALGSGFLNAA